MPEYKKNSVMRLEQLNVLQPKKRIVIKKEIKEEKPTIIDQIQEEEKEIQNVEFIESSRKTENTEDNEKRSELRKLHKTRRVRRSKRNSITPKSGIISD